MDGSNPIYINARRPDGAPFAFPPVSLYAAAPTMVLDQRIYPYGYIPTEYVCILFVVLFSVSTGTWLRPLFLYTIYWQ